MRAIASLFTPRALVHRFIILKNNFLDHQFERASPLPAVPDDLLDSIYAHPSTLPPRRYVGEAGGQTLEGLVFLASLTRALDARAMFEFGTFNGTTTWTLARNAPGSKIHTLDLPQAASPSLPVEESDHVTRSFLREHLYSRLSHDSEVIQLWGDSAEFEPSDEHKDRDLVYVDGAHSEPYVRRDTQNALSMVSESGVIVWDDYWREVAGVRTVLHEMRDDSIYRVPRTRLAVQLRPAAKERIRARGSPELATADAADGRSRPREPG